MEEYLPNGIARMAKELEPVLICRIDEDYGKGAVKPESARSLPFCIRTT